MEGVTAEHCDECKDDEANDQEDLAKGEPCITRSGFAVKEVT